MAANKSSERFILCHRDHIRDIVVARKDAAPEVDRLGTKGLYPLRRRDISRPFTQRLVDDVFEGLVASSAIVRSRRRRRGPKSASFSCIKHTAV
jgi:hypothetical protein